MDEMEGADAAEGRRRRDGQGKDVGADEWMRMTKRMTLQQDIGNLRLYMQSRCVAPA